MVIWRKLWYWRRIQCATSAKSIDPVLIVSPSLGTGVMRSSDLAECLVDRSVHQSYDSWSPHMNLLSVVVLVGSFFAISNIP